MSGSLIIYGAKSVPYNIQARKEEGIPNPSIFLGSVLFSQTGPVEKNSQFKT